MADWRELKRLAEAAAEIESWYEVRDFYAGGISEMELDIVRSSDRDFIIATSPAAILALIAENERLQDELVQAHQATNSECMDWAREYERRKEIQAERDQLRVDVEQLKSHRTDWQAKCLKRGFEYVRESDDHYVLADTPEMAVLLGELLGVEVRSKDNDGYGETVSELREQLESASASFHRAYELEKENEALRKDAERYRWLRSAENDVAITFGIHAWEDLSDEFMDAAIDAAMGKGGRADG